MCKRCVDSVRKHFPDCPDEEMGDFLFTATAYPAGDHECVERQLAEHKAAGCTTWTQAMQRADEETERAMAEYHTREAFDSMGALFP